MGGWKDENLTWKNWPVYWNLILTSGQKWTIRNPQFLANIFYNKNTEKFQNTMLATASGGWGRKLILRKSIKNNYFSIIPATSLNKKFVNKKQSLPNGFLYLFSQYSTGYLKKFSLGTFFYYQIPSTFRQQFNFLTTSRCNNSRSCASIPACVFSLFR